MILDVSELLIARKVPEIMLKIMITEMNKLLKITQDMECPRSLLKIYMGRIVSARL